VVRVRRHAQHIVIDQHLARRVRARADANRGDLERLGDGARDGRGHALHDDGEGPGILQG
jgi:hypothetical protein